MIDKKISEFIDGLSFDEKKRLFEENCTDESVYILCTCIDMVCNVMKQMRRGGFSDKDIVDTMVIFVKKSLTEILSSEQVSESFKDLINKMVFEKAPSESLN